MKTYAELEAEYLALCRAVQQDARRIVGLAGTGRADAAAEAAVALVQMARTREHQYTMQQEQAGSYDLNALRVNAETPSNSETGWERED
jgi:hypothetical protein